MNTPAAPAFHVLPVPPAQPQSIEPPLSNARYLSLVERIIFEHLGGIDMLFGREQAIKIVVALVKKYPVT